MTGRRRKLILAPVVLVLLGAGAFAGYRLLSPPPPPAVEKPRGPLGKWYPLRGHRPRGQRPPRRTKEQARLESLPYLAGYKPAPEKKGVTLHQAGKTHDGYNLIFSGHGPEATLIDMRGQVVQRWKMSYREARKHAPDLRPPMPKRPWSWRRGYLYPDGHLLAIYDGFGLIKLDRGSRLVWAFTKAAHHDLDVVPGGEIHVLTRRARVVKRLDPARPVLLDYISVLSPEGTLLRELALLEAFERSEHAGFLERMQRHGDIFHTNTIEVLDGRHGARSPIFDKGNVLISVREIDVVAIVSPREQRVVWAASWGWRRQHDPLLLASGNLLLFDNLGDGGKSRVLELEPLTRKQVWEYRSRPGQELASAECGAVHRLPNGNTLIVESLNGRAIEVTPEKQVVWEYYNPHRAGANNELIATLFDVIRVDAAQVRGWLGRK